MSGRIMNLIFDSLVRIVSKIIISHKYLPNVDVLEQSYTTIPVGDGNVGHLAVHVVLRLNELALVYLVKKLNNDRSPRIVRTCPSTVTI